MFAYFPCYVKCTCYVEGGASIPSVARRAATEFFGFCVPVLLGTSARSLHPLSNLPSPHSAVAARWHPDPVLACPRRRFASARQTGFVGSFHRRQLPARRKKGRCYRPDS